jgi:putative exporter of polyketide antibiotics
MMLRIALRLHRGGLLACGALGLVIGLSQAHEFQQLAGTTPAQRLKFGHDMAVLAKEISYLLPLPVHPETLAGYVQWHAFGTMPLIVAPWAILSATGAIRGEEARGVLETWLSAGVSRPRLIITRLAAFAIVAAVVAVLTAVGCALGAGSSLGAPSSLAAGGLLGECVALTALSVACFALSLLIAQLAGTRAAAAAWAAVVLLVLYLLDSLSRSVAQPGRAPSGWRWLSPFQYYDFSDAVAPGGHLDLAATAVLVAIALLATALAALAFQRRDLGAALLARRRTTSRPVRVPAALLRLPVVPALYEQRLGLLAWLGGTAVLAAFMVSVAKQSVDSIRQVPSIHDYLSSLGGGNLELAFVGSFWFGAFQLALAAYAITQVSRWTAEDVQGRLEIELSQPIHRWRIVIERAVALLLSCGLIILIAGLAVLAVAPGQKLTLSGEDVVRASLPLLPFALAFGAVGAALAGGAPRATVPTLSILAVTGYLLDQLGPVFQWPDWLNNFSVFHLYGTPLTSTIFWNGLWTMIAISVAGFAVALWTMEQREVGR